MVYSMTVTQEGEDEVNVREKLGRHGHAGVLDVNFILHPTNNIVTALAKYFGPHGNFAWSSWKIDLTPQGLVGEIYKLNWEGDCHGVACKNLQCVLHAPWFKLEPVTNPVQTPISIGERFHNPVDLNPTGTTWTPSETAWPTPVESQPTSHSPGSAVSEPSSFVQLGLGGFGSALFGLFCHLRQKLRVKK